MVPGCGRCDMAAASKRLRGLRAGLWVTALLAGGISATGNSSCNSTYNSIWLNETVSCSWVHQYPRYVAAKKNTPVRFICYCSEPQHTQWYRMQEDSEQLHGLEGNTSRYSVERTASYVNFTIFRIAYADNGIYVCDRRNLTEAKQVQACGTELQVLSLSSIQQVQNRNTLKDAIIIIQTILLVVFISVPLLLFLDKGEGKESPEEDHTYEGLEVEQMATYEDITPFRDVKAKWTVGEHPGEE